VSAEAFDRAVEQHGGDDVQIARELEVMVWVAKALRCARGAGDAPAVAALLIESAATVEGQR